MDAVTGEFSYNTCTSWHVPGNSFINAITFSCYLKIHVYRTAVYHIHVSFQFLIGYNMYDKVMRHL